MDLTPEYYSALLPFRSGPQSSNNPPPIYAELEFCGWIEPTGCGTSTYKGVTQFYDNCWAITPQGRAALAAYEKAMNDDTEKKKQNRITNYFAAINIVLNIVFFALGAVLDHWLGLVALVEALLQAKPPV